MLAEFFTQSMQILSSNLIGTIHMGEGDRSL